MGGPEYVATMQEFGRRWEEFPEVIRRPGFFRKDQWQFQMQCRPLAKVGLANLRFFTPGLAGVDLADLAVTGKRVAPDAMAATLQGEIDRLAKGGAKFAVLPEGPYCAPLT